MSFGAAVASCFRKYATFDGRARRSEFWWWTLFTGLLYLSAAVVDRALGVAHPEGAGITSALVSLALALPSIAVTVRRLHDTDHSGWLTLFGLVPIAGSVVVLTFCVIDGEPDDNLHGHSPKYRWPTNR